MTRRSTIWLQFATRLWHSSTREYQRVYFKSTSSYRQHICLREDGWTPRKTGPSPSAQTAILRKTCGATEAEGEDMCVRVQIFGSSGASLGVEPRKEKNICVFTPGFGFVSFFSPPFKHICSARQKLWNKSH